MVAELVIYCYYSYTYSYSGSIRVDDYKSSYYGWLLAMKAGTLPFVLRSIAFLVSSSIGFETSYSFYFFGGLPLVFLGTSLVS